MITAEQFNFGVTLTRGEARDDRRKREGWAHEAHQKAILEAWRAVQAKGNHS